MLWLFAAFVITVSVVGVYFVNKKISADAQPLVELDHPSPDDVRVGRMLYLLSSQCGTDYYDDY